MIVGVFEMRNTIGVTMANYVKILFGSFGLCDKAIVYGKDGSN